MVVMHTDAARHSTGRFAIPSGGPGLGRVAKVGSFRPHQTVPLCLCPWHYSWCGLHYVWRTVVSSTHSPTGIYDVVPSDRVAVLKAAVEFATSKVGQALGQRRLNTVTVAPVTRVVNAKKRAEVDKARPGENAPLAIITCIEAAMRSTSYADGVIVEQS